MINKIEKHVGITPIKNKTKQNKKQNKTKQKQNKTNATLNIVSYYFLDYLNPIDF